MRSCSSWIQRIARTTCLLLESWNCYKRREYPFSNWATLQPSRAASRTPSLSTFGPTQHQFSNSKQVSISLHITLSLPSSRAMAIKEAILVILAILAVAAAHTYNAGIVCNNVGHRVFNYELRSCIRIKWFWIWFITDDSMQTGGCALVGFQAGVHLELSNAMNFTGSLDQSSGAFLFAAVSDRKWTSQCTHQSCKFQMFSSHMVTATNRPGPLHSTVMRSGPKPMVWMCQISPLSLYYLW